KRIFPAASRVGPQRTQLCSMPGAVRLPGLRSEEPHCADQVQFTAKPTRLRGKRNPVGKSALNASPRQAGRNLAEHHKGAGAKPPADAGPRAPPGCKPGADLPPPELSVERTEAAGDQPVGFTMHWNGHDQG